MSEGGPARGAGGDVGVGPVVVWRFSDGKAGHDNQSLGLAEALAREVRCDTHTLTPLGAVAALTALVKGSLPAFASYPDPDLILGAGHGTHLSMLAARRARGGRLVLMMSPTLPRRLFDLCLIPQHDRPGTAANVVVTRGALNRVRPGASKDPNSGLILIGGPSDHFRFDQSGLLRQIDTVLKRESKVSWTATTSRRTPAGFAASLKAIQAANFTLVPVEDTPPDWVGDRLGRAAQVWVTEDSASMLYEALSSGAAVGLLGLDAVRTGRVAGGIAQLVEEGRVTHFDQWLEGKALANAGAPLNEAARCARLILGRWPELDHRP